MLAQLSVRACTQQEQSMDNAEQQKEKNDDNSKSSIKKLMPMSFSSPYLMSLLILEDKNNMNWGGNDRDYEKCLHILCIKDMQMLNEMMA